MIVDTYSTLQTTKNPRGSSLCNKHERHQCLEKARNQPNERYVVIFGFTCPKDNEEV